MSAGAYAPPPMRPLPQSAEWFLVRDRYGESRNGREGFTLGEIRYGFFDSARVCYTVEDFDYKLEQGNGNPHGRAAIPAGRYQLSVCKSPKYGISILLHAVDGFTGVEIHARNGAEALRGCIAVGTERLLDGVRNSQLALTPLITELRRLNMRGIKVYLNVCRAE